MRKVAPPSFSVQRKNTMFSGKKNTTFPGSTRKIMSRRDPFWKDHLFRTFEENIVFLCIYLRKIIFHFLPGGKIIFSGKRNIILPDNTRKIKFQRNFFWKGHLFRTSGKRNYGFPCNLYCVRWVIVSLAVNKGKLQSLVSEVNFCWVYNDFCSDFLLYDVIDFVRM